MDTAVESTPVSQTGAETSPQPASATPERKRPNKTERKLKKYEHKLANYKRKKEEKKKLKQLNKLVNLSKSSNDDQGDPGPESPTKPSEPAEPTTTPEDGKQYLNKRILKQMTAERLSKVYQDSSASLKICIDCSFSEQMSGKEMSRLAQQIGRCYATNKSISSPVHLTLCNLDTKSKFYQELCRVNDGFAKYVMNTTEKPIESYYADALPSLAYLSPDSPRLLEALDVDKTYVIGGLVDETVTKQVTLMKCTGLKINTYSLPIEKYMARKLVCSGDLEARSYNFSKILAINQVFDILANFFVSKDWPTSLECGVPKRKGFYVERKEATS